MNAHMVNDNTVGLDFPIKRTKHGAVHTASSLALVRAARRIAPEHANSAAVEIEYGTDENDYRMVTFDPSKSSIYGF